MASVIEGAIYARKLELAKNLVKGAERIVILNALPLNAIQYDGTFYVKCIRFQNVLTLRELDVPREKLVNYIRHESTVKLLSKLLNVELKPSADLYTHKTGDVLVIVTLKKPQRGVEVEAREEDLECFICTAFAILQHGTTD